MKENRVLEYLKDDELDLVLAAAKTTRNPKRDYAIVLISVNHGLRVSELISLKWHNVDWKNKELRFWRLKAKEPQTHPFRKGDEKVLKALYKDNSQGYIFNSEQGGELHRTSIDKLMVNLGKKAGLPYRLHHHQLRHTCAMKFVNRNIDLMVLKNYMGHKSLNSTAQYISLSANQFKDLPDW